MISYSITAITLQHIQIFLTAAETCNFTRCSERLNLTQPGISKSISALEAILGFRLFQRSQREIRLTRAGRALYEQWKQAAQLAQGGYERALAESRAAMSSLDVGIAYTTDSLKYFLPLANAYKQQCPDVLLKTVEDSIPSLRRRLLNGDFDMILVPEFELGDFDLKKVDWKHIAGANIKITVPEGHRLYDRERLTMGDILDEPLAIHDPAVTPNVYKALCDLYGLYDRAPVIGCFYSSSYEFLAAVTASNCIHIGDDYFIWANTPGAGVKRIPLEGHFRGIVGVWSKANMKSPLKNFLDFLDESFKNKMT